MSTAIHNHTVQADTNVKPSQILVMGPQASAFANALVRLKGHSEIFHAETAAEAIKLLGENEFDHVLVDNRTDGALTLTIPRLAQLKTIKHITVLAGVHSAETIAAIPGIGQVITPPYNPLEIANSLGIEVKDSRKEDRDCDHDRRKADEATVQEDSTVENEEKDDRPALFKVLSAIVHFIPGLTPILSMLYKNIALTILAALFVAFVSYGIMIAFFLTSGDWSSPLQLQAGHELVVKAERERGELKVKRNLASQQLSEAEQRKAEAAEALLRANLLAEMTDGIIGQEIENKTSRFSELETEIDSLEAVLAGFGSLNDRRNDRGRLQREYQQRVISRQVYQQGMLNFAQIERQIADIKSEVTAKRNEIAMSDQSIKYLNTLKTHMNSDSALVSGTGQTAYVPLTNQIIEVRQIRSAANSDLVAADQAIPALTNSLELLTNAIAALEITPMIRAIEEPVNVLFVPYDNIDSYEINQPLYSCAVALFWCSEVGVTGQAIGGEISTTHPFFGKPIRGQFVEAHLSDKSAAKKDILHVGRPPFFF